MKYFIAALFLVNIISLAESGPWGRDKTRGGPMGDENRFNRSRYSGNCSHPWFNSTLGEFNNTFGFVPPLEKFQMFWEFLKNFFNESYGDFNETMDFPFPRKEHRRPGDGGRGHKPGSVTMEPSGNLDDVTFVPQNPGRRPPPPPPPPYDDGNDRPWKRPPPRNGDGGKGHKPGSVTMEPSGNLDDVTFVPQNPGRRPPPPPPPPYDDGNDRPGKRPPPRNGDGGKGHKPGSVTMEPSGNLDDVTFVPQNPGRRPPPPPPYDDGNDRPGKRPPPRNGGGRP